jgi:hypothetical protein
MTEDEPTVESGTEQTIETQPITPADAEKAKKKGSLFGDPIFLVE